MYGREAIDAPAGLIRLGLLSPRGERAILTVPSDTLMRLTCNPFFSYMEGRVASWLGSPAEDHAGQTRAGSR